MNHIRNALKSAKEEALKHPNVLLALASIPVFSLAKTLLTTFLDLTEDLFRSVPNFQKIYGPDSWAVVTGASDGIGKEFCFQLAQQKLNIVLISRNGEKTERVAEEIRKRYPGTKTLVISRDFVKCLDEGFFDDLQKELQSLDISVLVNNVGLCDVSLFENSSEVTLREMIIVNCGAITLFSRKLIPSMLTRKYKSAIINISSNAMVKPKPYLSLYSATKAFDDYLSRALALEFEGKIDILSMRPSNVRTPMGAVTGDSFYHINPDQFVLSTLKKLGRTRCSIGHWKHVLKRKKEDIESEKKSVLKLKNWAKRLEQKKI